MKKTMFWGALVAAAIVAPSVSAQTVVRSNNTMLIMPAELSKDGKTTVFGSERIDETNQRKFFVYDENFQLIKEFTTLAGNDVEYKSYSQQRRFAYKEVKLAGFSHRSDPLVEYEGLTIDQVLAQTKSYYPDAGIVTLLNGEKVVVRWNNYWMYEEYGEKYPVEVIAKDGNTWSFAYVEYYGENWGPYGEWEETRENTGTYTPGISYTYIMPGNGADNESYLLTNGIYGDSFAYVMERCNVINFNNEDKDESGFVLGKSWGQRVVTAGFDVYDDKNAKITSFDVPSGYVVAYDDLYFYKLGENKFVAIEAEAGNGDSVFIIYKLNGSLKASMVAVTPTMRVSPNAPKRGERVKVALGETVVDNCNVQVISVSGQVMYKGIIPAGSNEVNIDTHGFTAGMYVVNVVGAGINKEAAKIIVR